MSGEVRFAAPEFGSFVAAVGLSGAERRDPRSEGRWTDGAHAAVEFALPRYVYDDVLIWIDLQPFLWADAVTEQAVRVSVNDVPVAEWLLIDPLSRRRVLYLERSRVPASNIVRLDFELPNCASPRSLGVNDDGRLLGVKLQRLAWQPVKGRPPPDALIWQYGRPVGGEARKTFDEKIASGFWSRFVIGSNVLDIGYKGYTAVKGVVPILEGAIGIDLDYPGYDGRTLPFQDGSQDAVFSSHCLEHIPDYIKTIQEWHRVTKLGGHIITVVPSAHLYERARRPPSQRNNTHIRYYTPSSLLGEFEAALEPNSYRVRHMRENDQGYSYDAGPEIHPSGCYEIELVVEKIAAPDWRLAD